MTLLEQAIKAKDEGRFEDWFLSLPYDKQETLKLELWLNDISNLTIADLPIVKRPKVGPSEVKK